MSLFRYSALAILLFYSAISWAQQRRVPQKFISGEREIFIDSLWNEYLGEPPSEWKLSRGGVETMHMEDFPVIGFIASISEISPIVKQEEYLPKAFTIEMEVYFHNRGNEGYTIEFNDGRYSIRINREGIMQRSDYTRTNVEEMVGWRKVQIAVNGSALKAYYDGELLVNIADIEIIPTELNIKVLSHNIKNDQYAMIRNIRIAEGGIPLYRRFSQSGVLEFNNIHFDYNKASIRPDAIPVIDRIATMLKQHEELEIQIEGHTDSTGDADFNKILSEKRAQAVKDALVSKGIASERLQAIGYGEEQPITEGNDAQASAMNRRVTLRKN